MKLTAWFPRGSKPVHKGVYIASVSRNRFYRYWNGKWWSNGAYAQTEVIKNTSGGMRRKYGRQQEISWRGLTTKDGK